MWAFLGVGLGILIWDWVDTVGSLYIADIVFFSIDCLNRYLFFCLLYSTR